MFQSEPICVLTAGPTIDGRNVEQQVVDDIAETYNPKTYNARINEEHWGWSGKFGSVLSVEKRGPELWAILKPNSKLLETIEDGQLLHTSCEITPDYAKTGKYYLTGLALTDSPASLGTTEMHLSARKGEVSFCSGSKISIKELGKTNQSQEEHTFFSRLMSFMGNEKYHVHHENKEEPKMSKEIEELLKKSVEQNELLSKQVQSLVTTLSVKEPETNESEEDDAAKVGVEAELKKLTAQVAAAIALSKGEEPAPKKTAVENQIAELSSQLAALTEKLAKTGDEQSRKLAGEGQEEETYL